MTEKFKMRRAAPCFYTDDNVMYQNNQKKSKLQRKAKMYNNNFNHFFEIPNYYTYFYQIPNQSMECMQMSSYFPSIVCFPSGLPEGSQEFNLTDQIDFKKTTESPLQNMGVNEHDSCSEQKFLKSTLIVQPKFEVKQAVIPPCKDVKLDFRIEWKNQHRNIVPNLINQMISYLLKKIKSQKSVKKIFQTIPHDSAWTEKKFYLYMKKIKESITHYVNENIILKFLEIHEPKCELYDYEEQQFYMKVSRIAILKFLEDDAILISLTSNRMSAAKREIHLIARDALLRKFKEICRQCRQ